jgi:hypothetical protein
MRQPNVNDVTTVHLEQWPAGLVEYMTDVLAAMLVADYQHYPPTVTTPGGSNRNDANRA